MHNMETVNFSIDIKAEPGKVWQALWDDANYRRWTSVFAEGSSAESDWKEGSKVRFIGPNGDGMHGVIETMDPNRTMIFRHLGELKEGQEIESSWAGAREAYFLSETPDGTRLNIEMDTQEEYKEYFETKYPDALQQVKAIAEGTT